MTLQTFTEAYEEGEEAAALIWCSEQSCPYPGTSKERGEWLAGFQRARAVNAPRKGVLGGTVLS